MCTSLCVIDGVGWWWVQAVFWGGSRGPWEPGGGCRRGRGLLWVRVLQREVVDQRSASTQRQGQRSTPGQEEGERYSVTNQESLSVKTEAKISVEKYLKCSPHFPLGLGKILFDNPKHDFQKYRKRSNDEKALFKLVPLSPQDTISGRKGLIL